MLGSFKKRHRLAEFRAGSQSWDIEKEFDKWRNFRHFSGRSGGEIAYDGIQ